VSCGACKVQDLKNKARGKRKNESNLLGGCFAVPQSLKRLIRAITFLPVKIDPLMENLLREKRKGVEEMGWWWRVVA